MRVHYRTLAIALIAIACAKDAPPQSDSVAQIGNATVDEQWVPELGPLLAVPGDSDNTAILLSPASTEETGSVALMRTAGDSSATSRISPTDLQVCGEVPTARLASAGPAGWTVALAPGVTALRADSIESLASADSSALAADIARIGSAVANDSGSRFAGLPFAVIAAHRLTMDSSTIVIARVMRRIPQEATPLEERTLVIGEQQRGEPFVLKYSKRSSGAEDVIDHHLFLAAVRAGKKHFVLLVSEREGSARYEILERSGSGSWRPRWWRMLSC